MNHNPQSKSKIKSLKLSQNPQSTWNNPLNSSPSKMQYTIGKSIRSSLRQINSSTDMYYDIPDTKSKRSASIGSGQKVGLIKKGLKTPSPSQYYIPSQFTQNRKKGITISAGRQIIKTNSVFQKPKHDIGPGQYNIKNPLIDRDQKKGFSLSGRNVDLSDKWTKNIPGPGNYQTLQLLDNNLKSNFSRIQNVKNGRFPKSKRRTEFEEAGLKNVPSPGQYDRGSDISPTAKFPKHGGCSFGHTQRKGIIQSKKLNTPGPGSYKNFSEFIH